MTIYITYPFTTTANYTFDSDLIEIDTGVAQLVDLGGGTYSTANPTIKPANIIKAISASAYTDTITETGSDLVQKVIEVDGVNKYWDGTEWATSTGYSESNTTAEINTNISSLSLTGGKSIRPVYYLHSDDGSSTPSVTISAITYNLEVIPADPSTCVVSGLIYDAEGNPVLGATITANLELSTTYNSSIRLGQQKATTTTDALGAWSLTLVETASVDPTIKYRFEAKGFNVEWVEYRSVPDQPTADYEDLT
jgi:hypothetical protein